MRSLMIGLMCCSYFGLIVTSKAKEALLSKTSMWCLLASTLGLGLLEIATFNPWQILLGVTFCFFAGIGVLRIVKESRAMRGKEGTL